LENLYAEFTDWVKFLLIGISGIFFAVLMWRSEGLFGKAIIIMIALFIVAGAVVKTHSKYLNDKIKHQGKGILLERIKERIERTDKLNEEIAIRFQKYFNEFKRDIK
jgi:hypothetical protein